MRQEEKTPRRIRVLSAPHTTFPFPGMWEINVIAEVLDGEEKGYMGDRIVPVVIASGCNEIPEIGTELVATEYHPFYYEKVTSGADNTRIVIR